jgi:hypothetical protein
MLRIMKPLILGSLLVSLLSPAAWAGDEFASVKCGADVVKAVVGRKMNQGKVQALEDAHKDIGLKSLGGDGEPEDAFALVEWQICQSTYVFLIDQKTKREVIADAVMLPDLLKDLPQSLPGSECQRQGKPAGHDFFVLLEKVSGATRAPAKMAWRIDQATMKFVTVPIEGLSCDKD